MWLKEFFVGEIRRENILCLRNFCRMNFAKELEKALAYEANRHLTALRSGSEVEHETMLWDPARGEARPMRGKEEVHDYRYFPEPDLPTLEVPEETVERLARGLPSCPGRRSSGSSMTTDCPATTRDFSARRAPWPICSRPSHGRCRMQRRHRTG